MVKSQGPRAVLGVDDNGGPGVVAAPGRARRAGQEDGRDRVEARIAAGVGVGSELADERDLEPGLLARLPDGRGFERLAVFDEASREGPARRRIPALDENDALAPAAGPDLDDDIDRRKGISVAAAGHGRSGLRRHFRGRSRALSNVPILSQSERNSPHLGTARSGPPQEIRRGLWHEKCFIIVDRSSWRGERR